MPAQPYRLCLNAKGGVAWLGVAQGVPPWNSSHYRLRTRFFVMTKSGFKGAPFGASTVLTVGNVPLFRL